MTKIYRLHTDPQAVQYFIKWATGHTYSSFSIASIEYKTLTLGLYFMNLNDSVTHLDTFNPP